MVEQLRGPDAHEVVRGFFLGGMYPEASPLHLRTAHTRRIFAVERHVLPAAFGGMFLSEGQFAFKPQSEAYLQRIACPAFAFRAGRQDPSSVATWERAQFRHPYSKAVGWEGTGHFLHQERPAEFNELIRAWIAGLPAE
jgi:pimeloyl-ACP methyl ester carboxylesterase